MPVPASLMSLLRIFFVAVPIDPGLFAAQKPYDGAMVASTIVKLHRETSRYEPHELVRELNAYLGPTLVSALAGARSRAQAHEWAKPNGSVPRDAAWNRLQFAFQIWHTVEEAEGAAVTRRWFIGGNPLLSEQSPVIAIRDDRHAEVRRAAQAFLDGDVDE